MLFRSSINPNSDFGYIKYIDDVNNTITEERSRLIIGIENDALVDLNRDSIVLYPVNGAGRVGVNNLNPAYHLDVSGTCNVTSTVNIGGIPLLPVLTVGVWMWSGIAVFPIYGSTSNFPSWGINDIDNYWVVAPGYKVRVYDTIDFTGQNFTCSKTLGSFVRRYVIIDGQHVDRASSCRVFYNNVEIAEVVTVSNVTYGIAANPAGNFFT